VTGTSMPAGSVAVAVLLTGSASMSAGSMTVGPSPLAGTPDHAGGPTPVATAYPAASMATRRHPP
jgi:hypothetical protein